MLIPVLNPSVNVNHIRIRVRYQKGGTNFYNGRNEPGGFFLYVTPVEVSGGFERFIVGAGRKFLLEAATRDNKKKAIKLGERSQKEVAICLGEAWDAVCKVCALDADVASPEGGYRIEGMPEPKREATAGNPGDKLYITVG